MLALNGEINVLLEAIGCLTPNPRILEAVVIAGGKFEIEVLEFDENSEFWIFRDYGMEFKFDKDKKLSAIFIFIQRVTKNPNNKNFEFIDSLIEGFYVGIKKNKILDKFGKADFSGENWIKYMILDKYIHFQFNPNDELMMITVGL